MRLPVVPWLLVLLLAAPATAAPDVRALLIGAAQKSGCRLTEDQAEALFTPLGISKDDVGPVAQAMLASGEASLEGRVLRLSPELCTATAAPPTPAVSAKMAAVVAVFNANGCLLTDANVLPLLAAAGVTEADIEAMEPEIGAMLETGLLTELDDAAKTVRLEPPLCTAAPMPDLSPDMAAVVAVFQSAGCEMTEAEGMAQLAAVGMDETALDALEDEAEALEALGLVQRLEDGVGTVRMLPPLCTPGADAAADPDEPLIRMLTENGCRLTQDAAGPLLPAYGLTMKAADEMADSLMDRGLARREGDDLVLADCAG